MIIIGVAVLERCLTKAHDDIRTPGVWLAGRGSAKPAKGRPVR
jgi:hypothetical protein